MTLTRARQACHNRRATLAEESRRIRILFVSHYALPHLGGIEVVVDALARELVSRGHEVTHLAAAIGDASAPYRVLRVPAWNVAERFGIPYPMLGPSLRRIAQREIEASEVVHVHGMLYQASSVAMSIARRRKHRCRILSEHVGHVRYANPVVDTVERAAIATIGKRTARAAHAIVVLNGRVDLEMQLLAPSVPRITIPNGTDLARFRPPEPGERERLRRELGWDARPRALFVGRMVDKKGLREALAAANAANGAFDLILVGPGRVGEVPPNVTVMGAVSRDRVAEIYRAADVFLLPSRGEGFPLSAQEAMGSGLPVVLADDPAYRETVAGAGRAVTLVPPLPEEIARATMDIVASGARDLGSLAEAFARSRFSWERAAVEHIALYERVLGGGCQRGPG